MRRRVALVAMLALAQPLAASAELGRLFLTPEQRSALDARRKARLPDKPQTVVVESATTRINGYITDSRGRSTVWVNGEALGEGAQQEGMRVVPRRSDSSRVTIEVGEGQAERRIDLKVGQSLDRATGEVKDPLRGGEAARSDSAPKNR